ncbi:MAG: PqqD family peptide modification chaperone [Clostridium sp.]|uniref:PqqD family peptide modification chaperone n=1 Tax=Clostridium sp. TaxID=1506 RepID=UPI003F3EBD58
MMIKMSSEIIINKSVETMDIDDEKAMIDLERGKYYTLNETGSFIWDSILKCSSFKELVKELVNIYDIEEKECIEYTTSFLYNLSENGLIEFR